MCTKTEQVLKRLLKEYDAYQPYLNNMIYRKGTDHLSSSMCKALYSFNKNRIKATKHVLSNSSICIRSFIDKTLCWIQTNEGCRFWSEKNDMIMRSLESQNIVDTVLLKHE